MKKVGKKKIVVLGVILLLTCILPSILVQSKEEITITVKNESDYYAFVDIFLGKGVENCLTTIDIEWGETKTYQTNLTGEHDFEIYAYIYVEGGLVNEDIATRTTDSDFTITITKHGTLRIASGNDRDTPSDPIGDSDNGKEEISTSGFEFAFLAIAIVTIIILRRMKQ